MLFAAHSGLRFLVLLAGLFVVLYGLVGFFGKREYSAAMARLAAVFTGLLHLQVLTGIAVLFTRPFYNSIIGHLFLMLLAAAVAQLTSSVVRRRPGKRRHMDPTWWGRRWRWGSWRRGSSRSGVGCCRVRCSSRWTKPAEHREGRAVRSEGSPARASKRVLRCAPHTSDRGA